MNDLPCEHEHEKARRPLPDMADAVVALAEKASGMLDELRAGVSIGIEPIPGWIIKVHWIPKPKE